MTTIHRYPLTILETHLDVFGHVNNAVYLRLFEEARWDMITKYGYGITQIQEGGIGPIVLEVYVKFKKELKARQEVIIESYVNAGDRLTFQIHQRVISATPPSDTLPVYCEAKIKCGLLDLKRRRLIPPTSHEPTVRWMKELNIGQPSTSGVALSSKDFKF